ADLNSADLNSADLRYVNLSSANLGSANLSSAKNWTRRQLGTAKLCQTLLPAGANLDPNRDCKELGIEPEASE
ncbi:pentapeptide repeat-containing protein, partial [Leptolyngbya sp. FACHB-671]|uniref:pentapeptide repeat-containing protein n=1 Tax=Leptolyngbya sp. FACHB-671 TaxID=2692812 RepID=UPI001687E043|nr:pentapeptide repeat-containing protein [Leptolyngbya sp. FACHB-671]